MENENLSFEQKVKSMTAKEIILIMIEAVKNPVIKLDMDTFGKTDSNGECVGCAATNTVCKIADVQFDSETIDGILSHARKLRSTYDFVCDFEYAIDSLRSGAIREYNAYARSGGFATIKTPSDLSLPNLTTATYEQNLGAYEELAELQD